jgi:hypothetical protein
MSGAPSTAPQGVVGANAWTFDLVVEPKGIDQHLSFGLLLKPANLHRLERLIGNPKLSPILAA